MLTKTAPCPIFLLVAIKITWIWDADARFPALDELARYLYHGNGFSQIFHERRLEIPGKFRRDIVHRWQDNPIIGLAHVN
jgi:hypothetical protein